MEPENTGYEPVRRFCGSDTAETFYFDREGAFIGCEYCVKKKYWEGVRPKDIE